MRGATLIEVLVAVLILAIGLLGVAALQAAALRNGQSALESTQAVVQSYAMLDAMRANQTAARANNYNKGKTCAVPTAALTLVDSDWTNWVQGLKDSMGGSACGAVACALNVCTVTITWDDSRATEITGPTDSERNIITTTRI
ncbi:MAG: type IV pilus modification protein PilV [Pseudomonadota bacterium]|nr:type IV pilus modification protein PilV [Pseudomonadota bacterium]